MYNDGSGNNETVTNIETVAGGNGNDTITGNNEDNSLYGESGNDYIDGQGGQDWIGGDQGHDSIQGGGSDDYLHGNAGDDTIDGGTGNDDLSGNAGNDLLNGQAGDDDFFFNDYGTDNADQIDFSNTAAGNHDEIHLDGAAFTGLGTTGYGQLQSSNYLAGTPLNQTNANQHILFHDSSLYYDADGNGSGTPTTFANITNPGNVADPDTLHNDIYVF